MRAKVATRNDRSMHGMAGWRSIDHGEPEIDDGFMDAHTPRASRRRCRSSSWGWASPGVSSSGLPAPAAAAGRQGWRRWRRAAPRRPWMPRCSGCCCCCCCWHGSGAAAAPPAARRRTSWARSPPRSSAPASPTTTTTSTTALSPGGSLRRTRTRGGEETG